MSTQDGWLQAVWLCVQLLHADFCQQCAYNIFANLIWSADFWVSSWRNPDIMVCLIMWFLVFSVTPSRAEQLLPPCFKMALKRCPASTGPPTQAWSFVQSQNTQGLKHLGTTNSRPVLPGSPQAKTAVCTYNKCGLTEMPRGGYCLPAFKTFQSKMFLGWPALRHGMIYMADF